MQNKNISQKQLPAITPQKSPKLDKWILYDKEESNLLQQIAKLDISLRGVTKGYQSNRKDDYRKGHIFTAGLNHRGLTQIKDIILQKERQVVGQGFNFLKIHPAIQQQSMVISQAVMKEKNQSWATVENSPCSKKKMMILPPIKVGESLSKHNLQEKTKKMTIKQLMKQKKDNPETNQKSLIKNSMRWLFEKPQHRLQKYYSRAQTQMKKSHIRRPTQQIANNRQIKPKLSPKRVQTQSIVDIEGSQQSLLIQMLMGYIETDSDKNLIATWQPPVSLPIFTGLFTFTEKRNICNIGKYFWVANALSGRYFEAVIKHLCERKRTQILSLELTTSTQKFSRYFKTCGWHIKNRQVGNQVKIEFIAGKGTG